MENRNYYEILGVSPKASLEEINAAKNALAKRYHPDINLRNGIDTTRQMQTILEAFSVLSDSAKRADYDRSLTGRRPVMQTFDLQWESEVDQEPEFVTYWKASNELYDIIAESDELYRMKNQTVRLGELAMLALKPIFILREARIPERYWHPDIMNWLLFAWYQNRNHTISYLLSLYDECLKRDYGKLEMLRIQKKSLHYQRSVRKLMKY